MSHFPASDPTRTRYADAPGLDDAEPCGDCPPKQYPGPVSWSPAFSSWLCNECRRTRTDRELRATDMANAAALADRLASGQVAGDK
jgi:hypothetical protein